MHLLNPCCTSFLFPWILWHGNAKGRAVYLTFDDGPHAEQTPAVLDALAMFQAKATFFLTGSRVTSHESLVFRIQKDGHTIGNHGYDHVPMWFRNTGLIRNDIAKAQRQIETLSRSTIDFYRPPHGRFDPRFKSLLGSLDLRMVLWNLMSYDYREKDPEVLVDRVCARIHPGSIVVFHDGHRNGPILLDALPRILRNLKDRGYVCDPLTKDSACSVGNSL